MLWLLIEILIWLSTPISLIVPHAFLDVSPVHAANGEASQGLLNKLLAPGPLMEGHKELEGSRCLECHVAGGGIPDSQCLNCHKDIKKFVDHKIGFHGMATKTCIACHTDHKGRDFDSVAVDTKSFNHDTTGYKLEGKHADLKCTECHVEKRSKNAKSPNIPRPNDARYFGLKVTCVSCHKKDDVHFFTGEWGKKDCSACHGLGAWKKELKFEHFKDTHYKLEGKHAKITCAECHVPKKTKTPIYKWDNLKRAECLACHEDQHKGKFGAKFAGGDKCLKCHTQTDWKVDNFDHKKATGYALNGKHSEIECIDCHKQKSKTVALKDMTFSGLKKECSACHIDHHDFGTFRSSRLREPNACTACHNERNWKQTPHWDHNTNTRYAISGKHLGLECTQCHTPLPPQKRYRQYEWPHLADKTCENCHKSPHTKTFSAKFLAKKCTECHTDEGWKLPKGAKGAKKFDHSATRFQLTGEHTSVSCDACHKIDKKDVYKFEHVAQGFCIDCHTNVHVNQFHAKFANAVCTDCHTTKDFINRLPFKHNSTDFELTGKHSPPLECSKCHVPTKALFPLLAKEKVQHNMSQFVFKTRNEKFCVDCHTNVHINQFHNNTARQACTECHTTENFTHRLAFDHNSTSYKLNGKHANVECIKCHVATKEQFTVKPYHYKSKYIFPSNVTKDCTLCHKDPHEGHYGRVCTQCHTEKDWKSDTVDFHKNYTLSGVHNTLQCGECHQDDRKLSGLSQMCAACHRKDDVHRGALPDCSKCHEQHFWEDTSFRHSMTNFPLQGAHRTLDCNACHSNNIYKGLPSACNNCHLQDALNFTGTPSHATLVTRNCSDCHNQFSFH